MSNRSLMLAASLLLPLGAAPLLGACNTTAGAGKDISKTGDAIERSATRNMP
jgi:predicted small secreted protein